MKGLLLKDFYMAAKYCRAFLLLVIVFLAVSIWGDENVFFVIYPVLIAGMIPVTLYSYDEREKWTLYSGTLPYTRTQFVSSKYLVGLFFETAVFAVSIAIQIFRMTASGGFSWEKLFYTVTIFVVLGPLGPSLLLPFVFKFGAEKGRIAFYVVIGALCAAGTFFSNAADAQLAGAGLRTSGEVESVWIFAVLCIASVFVYILSWRLSVVFYSKRDLA